MAAQNPQSDTQADDESRRTTTLERINLARRLWREAFGPVKEAPVPVLHHYTTAAGLVGIVESNCLYASHIRYLNDSSEVTHALEVAGAVLNQHSKRTDPVHGANREAIAELGTFFFDNAEKVLCAEDAFVASFCENDDLLSQWRGYGMGGFCLGFDGLTINYLRNSAIWSTTVQKVIYRSSEKMGRLSHILAAGVIARDRAQAMGDDKLTNMVATVTALELQVWVHTVKHESFEHEAEWRIVSFVAPYGAQLRAKDDFFVRVTNGKLIPAIRLKAENGYLPLSSVRCGPNMSRELTEKAVKALLYSHGYSAAAEAVTSSAIPFRERY